MTDVVLVSVVFVCERVWFCTVTLQFTRMQHKHVQLHRHMYTPYVSVHSKTVGAAKTIR